MTRQIRGAVAVLVMAIIVGTGTVAEAQRKPPPRHAPHRKVVVVPIIRPVPVFQPVVRPGLNNRVQVLMGSRLDPTFAASAEVLAATRRDALLGYRSTQQRYLLYIPPTYRPHQSHALIVFVSSSNGPTEWVRFEGLCRKYGILFASPYMAGDDQAPGRRLRIALDVLEDVRQRWAVDTDRIYLAGLGGGGRIVSDIAFSYPEFIGGLLAVGGLGGLRDEPWMRDRVTERLSVAVACGGLSPNLLEVERWRYPPLRDSGARARFVLMQSHGQALPPPANLEEIFLWLEAGRAQRRALGGRYPPTRMASGVVPDAETWADGVLAEARKRLGDRRTRASGLLQLQGLAMRWKGTAAAERAAELLKDNPGWRKVYAQHQAAFAYREARALDDYLESARGLPALLRSPALLRLSLLRWEEVERHAPDTLEGKQAHRRVTDLRKLPLLP